MLLTRGLQEWACLLPQELPFATVARLLGWQAGEAHVLSTTAVRMLVREHGGRIRRLERGEATIVLRQRTCGQRLCGVPVGRPRRRAGWPAELNAAVAAALARDQVRPREGVSWADGERVVAARRAEAEADVGTRIEGLRRLGPEVAPGQLVVAIDEILTPAPAPGRVHELRTACLTTPGTRRSLSGTGDAFLWQLRAAVPACADRALLVLMDGARWIRAAFRDHLADLPRAEMVRDWQHLKRRCRDLVGRIGPGGPARLLLLRRLLRHLWGGHAARAIGVLVAYRPWAADPAAVDALVANVRDRAEWMPEYRARRRQRRYSGSGQGEKANDRILARRQKNRGMQWSARTSDTLAALRTLVLNDGWDCYWRDRKPFMLCAA